MLPVRIAALVRFAALADHRPLAVAALLDRLGGGVVPVEIAAVGEFAHARTFNGFAGPRCSIAWDCRVSLRLSSASFAALLSV